MDRPAIPLLCAAITLQPSRGAGEDMAPTHLDKMARGGGGNSRLAPASYQAVGPTAKVIARWEGLYVRYLTRHR